MPQIPIDGQDSWQDLQAILAVMAYPDDEDARADRFWAPVWAHRLAGTQDDEVMEIRKLELQAMLYADGLEKILKKAGKQFRKAQISGHLLVLAFALDGSGEEPSLRKAMHLAERHYKRIYKRDREVVKHSPATLWKAWKDFRSVAHLWGAFTILLFWYQQTADRPEAIEEVLTEENLLEFVGIAQQLYSRGVELVAGHQHEPTPLIDPDSAWTFPPFEEDVVVDPLPIRLPPWAAQAASEYTRGSQ